MRTSLYNNIKDTTNKDVSFSEVADIMRGDYLRDQTNRIRSANTKAEEQVIKDSLPLILGYGTFKGRKLIGNLDTPNGLLFFDYDEHKGKDIAPVVRQLILDKLGEFVTFMFTSPRYGVKFALNTDLATRNNDYYQFVYRNLLELVETMTELKLDSATCNLNRNTFIVCDPDVYVNEQAEKLSVDFKEQFEESKRLQEAEVNISKNILANKNINTEKQAKYAEEAIQKYSSRVSGERHKGIAALGFALYRLGYDVYEVTNIFTQLKNTGHYTEKVAPLTQATSLRRSWDGDISPNIFDLGLKDKMKILNQRAKSNGIV